MPDSTKPSADTPSQEPASVSVLNMIPKNAMIWVLVGAVLGGGMGIGGRALGGAPADVLTKDDLDEWADHHNEVDELRRQQLQQCIDSLDSKVDEINTKVDKLLSND